MENSKEAFKKVAEELYGFDLGKELKIIKRDLDILEIIKRVLDNLVSKYYEDDIEMLADKIEEDLEVLEILKNKLEIKSLDIGIEDIFLKGTNYIVMFEEEKDFNKVKEWLENDRV